MRRYLAFLLIPLSLSSCSLFKAKMPPYPGGVTFPLADAGRISYEGKILRTIQKANSGLYFSTDKGWLYCLDSSGPKIKWTYAAGSAFGCPPVVAQDSIFIWDQENNVYCFDMSGKILWRKALKEKISSPISWDQDKVYIGTQEGTFLAMNKSSGESLWQLKARGAIEAGALFWGKTIIVGCTDGRLYFLTQKQDLAGIVDIGSAIRVTPLLDGDRLYFGTDDSVFQCFDLQGKKRRWKIKAGGKVVLPPCADDKRIYFFASNSVLYCLKKRGGDILWWWISPSRSAYDLEFSADKVLITSFSPFLFCLDRRTGKELGRYDAKSEIRSNPLWDDPYVVINLHDYAEDRGTSVYLRQEVEVKLTASLPPPQPAGTEISFLASPVGFYLPKFEFSIRSETDEVIVQKESDQDSWTWYPEKEGNFTIGVKVRDRKRTMEAKLPFVIIKKQK
jgi:outer membrane protein assembly factor BamB